MPEYEATMRVVHVETWAVEAKDINDARRKFSALTEDVIEDDTGGEVVDFEIQSVRLAPQ